jgi:hypothetical protein
VVFDDQFTMVPFMEKNKVPPNWAQLVENSIEEVTEEHYELAKTWLFPDPEPGDILMLNRIQPTTTNHTRPLVNEKPSVTAMSHQIGSLLVLSPHYAPTLPVLLHSEFLNKIISQTLYCILSYHLKKKLLRITIFFQFLCSSIWRHRA